MKITVTRTANLLGPSLAAKLKTCRNPIKAHKAIGVAVWSLAQRAFTQGSLRPATWASLKPATIKAKKRKGYGSKPLISSGALAQSPRTVSVDSTKVVVGSDRQVGGHSLAGIHQLGSTKAGIPARPVWPFDKQGRPTERGRKAIINAARGALAMEVK